MSVSNRELSRRLEDEACFMELADGFLEIAASNLAAHGSDSGLHGVVNAGLSMLAKRNREVVFECAQSPIERIFLNSLCLGFIRDVRPFCLTGPMHDAPNDLVAFRAQLKSLDRLMAWYRDQGRAPEDLGKFLDSEVVAGKLLSEEREGVEELILYYNWLPYQRAYHLTVQASFPEIRVNKQPIRTDCLIWKPSDPRLALVVECDGFAFHSSYDAFVKDRKRDRLLKSAGFEVFRFSGSEIVNDPVGAAAELYNYLMEREQNV